MSRAIYPTAEHTTRLMTADEITALLARLVLAYNDHDAAAVAAHYTGDSIVESPMTGTIVGRPNIEAAACALFRAFPDMQVEPLDLLIDGGRVVQTATTWGTDTGGFFGLPPTGRPFRNSVVFLFTLKDGFIVHERRMYDFSGFLLQLAGETSHVSESARLYREILDRAQLQRDMKIAAGIQRALLPARHRTGVGFELAVASLPCRDIGGDFVDYFDLPAGGLGLIIGDVAGKGPPAALLAAELQGILAAQSYLEQAPGSATVTLANRVFLRRNLESRFATVLYGALSRDGCLTYCNAGHNPPFLFRRCSIERLDTGGLILGAFRDAVFEQEAVQLEPGDVLIAYSDGITEAMSAEGKEFGEDRLLSCAQANRDLPASALLERLLEAVWEFTKGRAPNDDMTALVLRRTIPRDRST